MKTSRRSFLSASSAFAFAPFAGCLSSSGGKPLFRMGVMTDTHVGTTRASCGRVKQALEVFKREGVDLVVNNGDIADHFYPEGYKALRETYSEVYPDPAARPREIWVYAWHDAFEFRKGIPRDDTWKQTDAFPVVRELLGAADPVTTSFDFHGLPMLVFHQFDRPETYERMLADAAAKHPGKPIFVFSHVPPRGTVYNSWNWGDGNQRRIYAKYPQVVAFSGHVHGSLRNDLFIWQKDFTVINAGCLQVWEGIAANAHVRNKQSYGVLTVDVYADRLLVRRFDVRDGSEIDPANPWQVALPFAAATAAYTPARKAARAAVPEYPDGARLAVEPAAAGGFTLTFPEVAGTARAFLHRAELARKDAAGAWRRFAVRETFGDSHLAKPEATGTLAFEGGYAEPGETVRVTVTPRNAYGAAGAPLVADYTVPAERRNWTTVLDETDLGKEIKLPDGIFAGPKGTRFRLTCDLDLHQPEVGSLWELGLVDAVTGKCLVRDVVTVGGTPGVLRYVFAFTQPEGASGSCRVRFGRGEKGSTVRVVRVKLARSAR